MDPCAEQRLGGLDIADAGDAMLIHQEYLDGAARGARELEKPRRGESRPEGLDAQGVQSPLLALVHDTELTETARVGENEAGSSIQDDLDPNEFWEWLF